MPPTFVPPHLVPSLVNLILAFVLGSLIGFERQVRQRTAGLRTNTLVALGAAVFVDMASQLSGQEGAVHVVAYVVSGIGFLGAGAIMKDGATISGLNTAATLWGSAAVGACAGAGLSGEAILAALLVLAANTLLRPIVNQINRRPIDEAESEVTYSFYVICRREEQSEIREKLLELLQAASYPVRDLAHHAFGQNEAEIEAVLFATAADAGELDQIVVAAEALDGVSQAFWNTSAED